MYTSIVLVALSSPALVAEATPSPAWLNDYKQARAEGTAVKKPVAVFLSPGKEGWNKVVRDGELDPKVQKRLAKSYVCLFLDTKSEEGKRLARAFEMSGGVGLVISDRSGEYQAFRHEGALTNDELARQLDRHAESPRPVVVPASAPAVIRTGRYFEPSVPTWSPPAWSPPAYYPAAPSRSYCPT